MHTITIANEKHLIESTRLLVNPFTNVYYAYIPAGRRLYKTGCRCTQIYLSNAGFRQPVACINQSPNIHKSVAGSRPYTTGFRCTQTKHAVLTFFPTTRTKTCTTPSKKAGRSSEPALLTCCIALHSFCRHACLHARLCDDTDML